MRGGRLDRFDDFGEDFRVFACEFSEDLAIEDDALSFETADEFGIGCTAQTGGRVDADVLQATVVALLEFAIAVGVCASFCGGGFGKSDFALAAPHHSFCAGKDITASLGAMGSTFYARHILGVWHE